MREESIKITLDNSSTQYESLMDMYQREKKHKLRFGNIETGIYEVVFFETLSYKENGVRKVETTFTLTRVKRADKPIIDK